MKPIFTSVLLLGLAAGHARAQVPHDTCVNPAVGVFTRPGAPAWTAWANGPTVVHTDLDDPRWNQATARSFDTGTASPPVHVRAVWSPDSTGQEYLYLSLVSDLDPNKTTPRDVFLGFRRPPGHTADTGSVGYIFQFHLAPNEDATGTALPDKIAEVPYFCGAYDQGECKDLDTKSVTKGGDWWRLFRDPDTAADPLIQCTTATGSHIVGHPYVQMNGADYLTRPFTWQASAADGDFVHYWKIGTNRWAIQVRIKIAPSPTVAPFPSIAAGIEKGSTFWYEVTESVTAQYLSIAKYPDEPATGSAKTGVHTSICVSPATFNDRLYHQELGTAEPNCPDCDPNKFSKLTDLGGDPGDCDTGIKLAAIGARFNTPGPYDTITPFGTIQAVDSSNVRHANTMIAQIQNTHSAAEGGITGTIQARFRIANWGSEPLGGDEGAFSDIRGGSAVCLGGACTPQTINAGQQLAIHFDWELGSDPVNGYSEYCAYNLTPPGGTCLVGNGTNGCATGEVKSQVSPDPTTGGAAPCVVLHNQHECMFVELTAPSGNVNFVRASLFNNMEFAEMSTVAREALIDARNLPRAPGQINQDIYFFVVPRNLPPSLPAGTTTTALIQSAAVTRALALSQPYLADIARLQKDDPNRLQEIIDALAKQRPGQSPPIPIAARATARGDERLNQIASAMRVMPNDDWLRAGKMVALVGFTSQGNHPNDDLVHGTVDSLGPTEAAQIVPTLEIYPFYKPAHDVVYQPMASFSLFLSHEQTLGGVRYEVDGATRVAENVYHLAIPVGNARKIQVRAQALTGNEALLPPGNPVWPCAGGCAACGGANRNCGLVAALGSGVPGLLAGMFVIRRRRRPRPARP